MGMGGTKVHGIVKGFKNEFLLVFLVLEKPKVKKLIHKNCWKNVSLVSVSFLTFRAAGATRVSKWKTLVAIYGAMFRVRMIQTEPHSIFASHSLRGGGAGKGNISSGRMADDASRPAQGGGGCSLQV